MPTDVQGKVFAVGQKVARARSMYARGDGNYVEITEVTKITVDKVYLGDSKQPIKFPERLAIIS